MFLKIKPPTINSNLAGFFFKLQIRFTSYSGTKDLLENLAWLPTSIMGFDENKKPKLAQWNYRILSHPLSKDLPTSHLKPIMDPHSQKMNGWNDEKFLDTRAIRFNIEGIKSILKENSVLK